MRLYFELFCIHTRSVLPSIITCMRLLNFFLYARILASSRFILDIFLALIFFFFLPNVIYLYTRYFEPMLYAVLCKTYSQNVNIVSRVNCTIDTRIFLISIAFCSIDTRLCFKLCMSGLISHTALEIKKLFCK